ncbi:MAG TPA: right-handed parallel beta-helix repeat-containing protein [Phycisphaerae bacterium]|nr:right-handed parallel beta-helix repeat-containing protein [Phycisphaerae bacterium]
MALLALLAFQPLSACAAEYYAAPDGADSNPGTLARPFKTIQKAAGIMVAGDTCYLRAGTYRETIRPANSGRDGAPITFAAYQGEEAVVNGADVVSGWTVHNGHIYKAAMGWDMGEGKNQVFVNRLMMIQARHPNTGLDLLDPTLAAVSAGANDYIDCSEFNQPAGFWNGGLFWGSVGSRWTSLSAKIVASEPGRLTVTEKSSPWKSGTGPGYVTGVLGALDAATEWHYEKGTLYLWAPDDANPSTLLVEAKRRDLVADLSNRSYIVLSGLDFFSGTVDMTGSNCTIDGCEFRYLSHYTLIPSGGGYSQAGGIHVSGIGNLIENSTVAYSAGSLIRLEGSRNTVRNCLLHDINYVGTYAAGVALLGDHNVIERNTMYNAGRFIIFLGGTAGTIRNNDMGLCMLFTEDGGHLYTHDHDGQGTEIAYNWIHDNGASAWPAAPGIYLDDGTQNYVAHHNVIWNCLDGIRLGQSRKANIKPVIGHRIFNNTLWWNRNTAMATHGDAGLTDIRVYNDLSDKDQWVGTDLAKNLSTNDLASVARPVDHFQLQSNSPAIDYGQVIAGITDGYVGAAPDAGAYEYGGSDRVSKWTAGRTNAAGAAAVTYVGAEISRNNSGTWGADPATGDKSDFRSTANGTKAFTLPGHPNAYGADGYIMFGQSGAAVTQAATGTFQGTISTGTRSSYATFNTPAPGIASVRILGANGGAPGRWKIDAGGAGTLDDASRGIGTAVDDVVNGTLWYHWNPGQTTQDVIRITLDGKARGLVIRIGVLVDRGDRQKPGSIGLNGVWQKALGTSGYNLPDWYFFDITNAGAGEILDISITPWIAGAGMTGLRGLVFDAVELPPTGRVKEGNTNTRKPDRR